MKHLLKEELLLYGGDLGLTANDRERMEEHLLTCEKCSNELSQLRLRQKIMTGENEMDCLNNDKNLLPYIENELNAATGQKMKRHLDECSLCQAIYDNLTSLPSWDTNLPLEQEIPLQTQERIESIVFKALKKKKAKQFVSETKERIRRGVEEFINEITLILRPLRPEVAFRGDDTKDLKVIEHPGGDLQINTGIENIAVKLTSIFEEFTVKAKTNKDGVAIFKNLKKGDYVSQVNGYQLDEIKM